MDGLCPDDLVGAHHMPIVIPDPQQPPAISQIVATGADCEVANIVSFHGFGPFLFMVGGVLS